MRPLENVAIVAIDVAPPEYAVDYMKEFEVNELFVQMLNCRLKSLQEENIHIIEINYYKTTHQKMTIAFNLQTTDRRILFNYFADNNIKNVVYVGLHYGICTHASRELSPVNIKDELSHINFFVAPTLCRPLRDFYWQLAHDADFLPHVYL